MGSLYVSFKYHIFALIVKSLAKLANCLFSASLNADAYVCFKHYYTVVHYFPTIYLNTITRTEKRESCEKDSFVTPLSE